MHRPLAARRILSPLLAALAAASSFAACAPWDLGSDDDLPDMNDGNVAVSAVAPPAISGGTLLVSSDGNTAVATDPDRDRVWIVDLEGARLVAEVALEDGDEPGRVVEDAAGRFHVALRSGGALVTIDAAGKITDRRGVCPAPRGIAFDEATDVLHVACVGGELVTLPAAGGAAVRTLRLDRDLRDVIVDGDKLLVSRFRAAELLTVLADGTVSPERDTLPNFMLFGQEFEPAVAWRTLKLPGGGVAMVHQRAMTTPVAVEEGGYAGGGCDGSIVHTTISPIGTPAQVDAPVGAAPALSFAVLPVDLAVSPDGLSYAIVAAGTDQVLVSDAFMFNTVGFEGGEGFCMEPNQRIPVDGEPTAVAFAANALVVQTREPAAIHVFDGSALRGVITLPGESKADTGHELFHNNKDGLGALACASCHPEGREDGRTWQFDGIGARRTQFVSGGILGTAPFHWDGDLESMDSLMGEVFENRMGGVHQSPRRVRLLARWLDAQPMLPLSPPADAGAIERGKQLFEGQAECAACHTGASLTNNKSEDVGTGKRFQVPSLVGISARAPFMHDGCAPTLMDRFTNTTCGGGDAHGKTSQLDPTQLADLVAYLESL